MVLVIILLLSAIIVVCYVYTFIKYKASVVNKIPGPSTNPILGNLLNFPKSQAEVWRRYRKLCNVYYPIYRVWGNFKPTVNLLLPEDIELILSNTKHNEKSRVYKRLCSWLGTGLLTSSGAKWQTRRKILTPAFHFKILQQFVSIFAKQSDLLVERLKDDCAKPYTDITPFITQYTLNTICETAMGSRLDFSDKDQKDYRNAVERRGELLIHRITRPWLFFDTIYKLTPSYREEKALDKVLHNFSMSVIKKRKAIFSPLELSDDECTTKQSLAMLDLLISAKNNGESIDDDGIREEVDTFMFEGHDTTAASIGFTLMLLAHHKDVQDKVVQELNQVIDHSNYQLTYIDLQNLKYLERVLKESLRMYPSVPFIGRITGEELKTHTGYTIPAQCHVAIHIYDLHYNPDIYPEPSKFDPDRFLPEHVKKRHPYAYLPFSAGSRNCIGQKFALLELKSVISSILKNFVLEPVDSVSKPTLAADLVLRPVEGIKIKIRPRLNEIHMDKEFLLPG